MPSPGDLPKPGIKTRSPALQVDSLLSEPPGKPKNIGVSSLSLLQEIFPTQESNWGLQHCRQILYQLSYQGNPMLFFSIVNTKALPDPEVGLMHKCRTMEYRGRLTIKLHVGI